VRYILSIIVSSSIAMHNGMEITSVSQVQSSMQLSIKEKLRTLSEYYRDYSATQAQIERQQEVLRANDLINSLTLQFAYRKHMMTIADMNLNFDIAKDIASYVIQVSNLDDVQEEMRLYPELRNINLGHIRDTGLLEAALIFRAIQVDDTTYFTGNHIEEELEEHIKNIKILLDINPYMNSELQEQIKFNLLKSIGIPY